MWNNDSCWKLKQLPSFEKQLLSKTLENFLGKACDKVPLIKLQTQILQFYFKRASNKDDSQNDYFVEQKQPVVRFLLKRCLFLPGLIIVDIGWPIGWPFLSKVILSEIKTGSFSK